MSGAERIGKIRLSMFLFDEGTFPEKVANLTQSHRSNKSKVKDKLLYFARYLQDICASTVIVEERYTDQNLQSDRWACASYDDSTGRHPCARLHFFDAKAEEYPEMTKILNSLMDTKSNNSSEREKLEDHNSKILMHFLTDSLDSMEDSYLGFMVIQLEGTKIVGTTCLSTYPVGNGVPAVGNNKSTQTENREIPAVMECSVNLVGHKISVGSIGFREQDGVTSACATCSLWSLFQRTSEKYQHHSLSPGKITTLALGIEQHGSPLPAELGLTLHHIERAIRSIPGLHPFNITHSSNEKSKLKLNAILNFALPILDYGIPVILQIEKIGYSNPPVHAICLVGYNYTDGQSNMDGSGQDEAAVEINTRAKKITSLIAHDDNVGPFVQYNIDDEGNITPLCDYLPEGHINKNTEGKWYVRAAITALHHSIRIYPYKLIQRIMCSYDRALRVISSLKKGHGVYCSPQWTSKIWDSKDYKRALVDYMRGDGQAQKKLDLSVESKDIDFSYLRRVQECNLPKHIMVLHARKEIEHDIILNLAGPWDTEMFIHVIPFSSNAENYLNELAEFIGMHPHIQDNYPIGPILSYMLKFLKQDALAVD